MFIDLSNLAVGLSLTSLLVLFAAIIKVSMKIGALELKVDTMWAFQMRRAMSEVVTSGIGTVNSPLKFTREAYENLEPFRDELRSFWAAYTPTNDAKALLRIEQKFGDILLRVVCIPCGLSYGACLLLALSIAKGGTFENDSDLELS